MESISILRAALDGDVAAIDRLVAEDGRWLNAQMQGDVKVGHRRVTGCSPLMLAAWKGHDAAVARLLALGADVGMKDWMGCSAVHWACIDGDHSSVLALLLDAGASISAIGRWTPLMQAAICGHRRCVALLIDRGGEALDLDAKDVDGWTALHCAAADYHADIVQLLLQADADPTIRDNEGKTPLNIVRYYDHQPCIVLLEAAVAEPQRSRLLFKARALLEASYRIDKAYTDAEKTTLSRGEFQRAVLGAAPLYLKGRVERGEELPRVEVEEDRGSEQLAACVKYALGLEGGGIVLAEGQEPTVGMLPEVLLELLELLVPKWDPAQKGRPLGWEEEEEEGDEHDDEDGDY